MRCELRDACPKTVRVARQDHRFRVQTKAVVRCNEARQQPAAEESRAAGDEHGSTSKVFPDATGVREDVFEIGFETEQDPS